MQTKAGRKELLSRIITKQESEAQTISLKIKDNVSQALIEIKEELNQIKRKLQSPLTLSEQLQLNETILNSCDLLDDTILNSKRISSDLWPSTLETNGLLHSLTQLTSTYESRNCTSCRFETSIDNIVLNYEKSIQIYRIAEEALINICEHAVASKVLISLIEIENKKFNLIISDNGKGFSTRLSAKTCWPGLCKIAYRASMIDAHFDAYSEKRLGTILSLEFYADK